MNTLQNASVFGFSVVLGIGSGALYQLAYQPTDAEFEPVPPTPQTQSSDLALMALTPAINSQPEAVRSFESLSHCEQMDAIDRDGKSVSEFIANSHNLNEYISAVKTECTWHSEQADQASMIIAAGLMGSPTQFEDIAAEQHRASPDNSNDRLRRVNSTK